MPDNYFASYLPFPDPRPAGGTGLRLAIILAFLADWAAENRLGENEAYECGMHPVGDWRGASR